ncbi:cytochrome P450 [Herbiconiux sp.]|uniref:cytochrome P450 n=1 Tax=Herbiconiux sp. TaxID=1871186 RepID=UPI0025BE8FDD|nr:cytochrome P450 [Herbiconiux sp.]
MSTTALAWNPEAEFAALRHGEAPGTAGVYEALLHQGSVGLLDRGDGNPSYGLFSREAIQKAALDTATFSSVTVPPGTPRILPLMADPPEHTPYRRLFGECFKADEIARVEAEVRPLAAEWLDRMIAAGSADFSQEYAYPFTTHSLCVLLRVEDDWSIFNDWSSTMEKLTASGSRNSGNALPAEHFGKIIPYLGKLIGEARQNPGTDPVSRFLAAEIDGSPLDDQIVIGLIIALILAGRSTTASGVTNLVLRLAQNPELQAFLRAHPERISDAMEESLRLDSPQQQMPRMVTTDVTIDGVDIPAGSPLFLNYGSANVDPAFWDRPAEYDLDRPTRPHFAFGRGMHQCPGAPLGRMQIRLTIEELLKRTRSFTLTGPIERDTWPRLSVERMPLTFVPA